MTNKKVTDILPPQKTKKERVIIKEKEIPSSLKIFASQKPSSHFKKVLILFSFFLILGGAFCYFTLSKAEIEIWPETQVLNLETEVTVDRGASKNNISAKIIPGQILEKEKTIVETFQSSGKVLKETKAEGMIRVYNDYSTSAQALIATTRFVSSDGKVFRTPVSVTIPGGTYQAGKFISGEIDIRVVADQPGPEYNIGQSTFSIPGFAGTDRYTKFYAKSFQPMSGGFREEISRVTKEDIVKAEEVLTKKGKKECEELLSNELRLEEISSNFNYIFKESRAEIIEKFSLADPEEESKEFKFQVESKCEILLFGKKDLEDLVKELISEQVSEGNKLYQESLKINYSSKSTDLDSGKMTLSLSALVKTYPEIDIFDLKNALAGKSLLQTKIFLENQPEIDKVNVNFWPFWVKKVPEDSNKVRITIKINP